MANNEKTTLIKKIVVVLALILGIGAAQYVLVKKYPCFTNGIINDPAVYEYVTAGSDRENLVGPDSKLPADVFAENEEVGTVMEKYRELDKENGVKSVKDDIAKWSKNLIITNLLLIFPVVISAMLFGYTGVIATSVVSAGIIAGGFYMYFKPALIVQLNTAVLFMNANMSFDEIDLISKDFFSYMDSHLSILNSVIMTEAGVVGFIGIIVLLVYEAATNSISMDLEAKNNEVVSMQAKMFKLENAAEELQKLDKKYFKLTSRLTNLQSFTQEVGKTLNVSEVCKKTLKVIVSALNAEKCCIYLYDEDGNELKASEAFGWSEDEKTEKGTVSKDDSGLIMRAISTEKIQSMNPEDENSAKAAFEMGSAKKIPSTMCAPLMLGEKKIGVLNIEKMEGSPGTEEIRLFYYIATLTAMAIENSKLFQKTEQLANFDGLTKMYTHRYMQDFLDRKLEESQRYKHPLSIILTDIDHFKNFNDKYGHQVGDMVLAETAKLITQSVRNVDLAARYGGEEFMAILPETDYKGAYTFAERLRRAIEAKSYYNEKTDENLRVTMSIGVAQYPLHHTDKAKLIEKADNALYEAKENGRNQVKIAKISREALQKMKENK